MTTFLQIHSLTTRPPSCVNRDQTGQPKTALFGGILRGRDSSQCRKRAIRLSDKALNGGFRTKEIPARLLADTQSRHPEHDEDQLHQIVLDVSSAFSKCDEAAFRLTTAVFTSKAELDRANAMIDRMIAEPEFYQKLITITPAKGKTSEKREFKTGSIIDDVLLMPAKNQAVDVALFGRMLAAYPQYDVEAALSMSHALTVNEVAIDPDFFTAVDDWQNDDNAGSAHMDERGLFSGVMYLYACIDLDLLVKNLGGLADPEGTAKAAVEAFICSFLTVTPTGYRGGMNADGAAEFAMIEAGPYRPRQMAGAFTEPVRGSQQMATAIQRLRQYAERIDSMYGNAPERQIMDMWNDSGSLADAITFAKAAFNA